MGAYGALATPLPTPDADGGFMAAYGRISLKESTLSNNYLFRIPNPGFADSNTMETNLDINNNDIVNANYIVSDNLSLTNDLNINNTSGSGNALSVLNAFTTPTMNARSSGDDTKGNLTVLGDNSIGSDFTANNLTVLQNGTVGGGVVQSNQIFVEDALNVSGNSNFSVNLQMGTPGARNNITAANVYSINSLADNTLQINDTLQANITRRIDEVTVGRNLISATTTVGNTLTANGAVSVSGVASFNTGSTSGSNINRVIGSDEVTIQNMSSCVTGC